jgi:hypothetical protein
MSDPPNALLACLEAASWRPAALRFISDGERVRALLDGEPVGVDLRVWTVSVSNLDALTAGGRALSLTVNVAELLAREADALPSCLVVWSEAERGGCWRLVDELVRALDGGAAGWRDHPWTQVELPRTETTGDEGLLRLFERLAGPHLFAPPPAEASLAPIGIDTSSAKRQVKRFFETGEPATVSAAALAALGVAPWFLALYTEASDDAVLLRGPREPLRADTRVELSTRRGTFTVAPVALVAERRGMRTAQWSNAAQEGLVSVRVSLDHDSQTVRMSVSLTPGVRPVRDLAQVARLLASLSAGAHVRVSPLAPGGAFPTLASSLTASPEEALPAAVLDLLEDLDAIERATGVAFSLSTQHPLSAEAVAEVRDVATATRAGRVEHAAARIQLSLSAPELAKVIAHAQGQRRVRLVLPPARHTARVLDRAVSLGLRQRVVTGTLALPCDELQRALDAAEDEVLEVELYEVETVELFPDWPRRG